jgi:SAM-dependent methyltransferase
MISGRAEIREAYRNEAVARQYVEARFREPLGAMLHARQVAALTRIIRAQRPRRVLEIAPGPGRLTVDVAPAVEGQTVLVEASAEMLGEARRRLAGVVRRPDLLQGDAFHLPFGRAFDLVYSFRLIRHFVASERAGLYREIARVLRPGGMLVFDAINEAVSAPLRANARPGEYEHFDALTRPDVLAAELQHAGLELLSLEGVQRNYPALSRIQTLIAPRSRPVARIAIEITDRLGGAPLEWIVTCRRR